jgi:hypothetical protein
VPQVLQVANGNRLKTCRHLEEAVVARRFRIERPAAIVIAVEDLSRDRHGVFADSLNEIDVVVNAFRGVFFDASTFKLRGQFHPERDDVILGLRTFGPVVCLPSGDPFSLPVLEAIAALKSGYRADPRGLGVGQTSTFAECPDRVASGLQTPSNALRLARRSKPSNRGSNMATKDQRVRSHQPGVTSCRQRGEVSTLRGSEVLDHQAVDRRPVSEEQRRRVMSAEARVRFLELLANGWSATHAARATGFSRQRFYDLRARDKSLRTIGGQRSTRARIDLRKRRIGARSRACQSQS